tara:strand:- start:61 stop:429 length:369 start_codon:yes stop_codon:yes gene_type:complete
MRYSELRKIIREAVESEYYKKLKATSAKKGKVNNDAHAFGKVISDQIQQFISGIKSNDIHPDEIKYMVYQTISKMIEDEKDAAKSAYQKDRDLKQAYGLAGKGMKSSPIVDSPPGEEDDYFF